MFILRLVLIFLFIIILTSHLETVLNLFLKDFYVVFHYVKKIILLLFKNENKIKKN